MNGVSIILCCYNSAKRLPSTLDFLAKQKVTSNVNWEVILVNNNSTDDTEKIAASLWEKTGNQVPLSIVVEQQPGLSYAREKGMSVANYELLIWCDDDNWLCDTYVQTAYTIMMQDLKIGALGGWCDATFETKKPEWFDIYARYFAVSRQGKKSGDITFKKGCVYGAGMVLRKSHNLELNSLGFLQLLKDRVGTSLSSGGDTEYCYALRLLGYKMWFDERLYFNHFMSDSRLSLNYVSRLRKAMAYSNFILWPYLDLLKGKERTKKDFTYEILKGMPILPLRKMGALIFGIREQKEVAKRYFRQIKYRMFYFKTYKRNMEILKSWRS